MTDQPKDGGPAFASDAYHTVTDSEGNPAYLQRSDGMTLRDYFAGQALAGMLANLDNVSMTFSQFGSCAYKYADAMLAAREGPQ